MNLRRVTLEVSLKPFWDLRPEAIERTCVEIFRQWDALTRHADEIGIMFWNADGSELLDYTGRLDDTFEWAKWIGIANDGHKQPNDPDGICLHSKHHLYHPDAPDYTYRALALVVKTIRAVGEKVTGKKVFVGTTFDPGGEFAISSFKYQRHPEICMANTMGKATFVTCYATLHADTHAYAGFPSGIPEGTPLGTFLGRQAQHFTRDIGFDFLWLSNGFGFGLETWRPTGPLFDGQHFDAASAPGIREKILKFWQDFRAELPALPIEVRGTNLGTGADLATDAVPLREIYRGGFNITTPPNSPWAALNGDFGIELGGYLSRIVELPTGSHVPFRYYTHDPWWLNSPWLDRYGREAHDIYLPLAVARISERGEVQSASTLNLLSIDDSYGRMPVQVPNEVTPHLLSAFEEAPDAPGLITWVYPFDEFHDHAAAEPARLNEAFFHDWFIRCGINAGLPVNTVVSTTNFITTQRRNPGLYAYTTLLMLVPDAGSAAESALIRHLQTGGRALLFGPLDHASAALKNLLNLNDTAAPLSGPLMLQRHASVDPIGTPWPDHLHHRAHLSAGGITTTLRDASAAARVLATVTDDQQNQRVVALAAPVSQGGKVAWVRGSLALEVLEQEKKFADPTRYANTAALLRDALAALGVTIGSRRDTSAQPDFVLTAARHQQALWFSGYMRDTTVDLNLQLAGAAPIFTGCDALIAGNTATYRFPRAWHRECRVLVSQPQPGRIACHEQCSGHVGIERRLRLENLCNSTVHFLTEPGREATTSFQVNAPWPWVAGPFAQPTAQELPIGKVLTVHNITGTLLISW